MRKVFSLMLAVLICVSLAGIAFAEVFTPSVTYKDAPELVGGEDMVSCVVVTSVQAARKQTTDVAQEDRDLLIEVYEKLKDGTMKVDGLSEDYVIRDLMDISFKYADCRLQPDHGDKAGHLHEEDTTVELVLDLNIAEDVEVVAMYYVDGVWNPIKSVTNNGDGTLTCVFDDFCPVLFAVKG